MASWVGTLTFYRHTQAGDVERLTALLDDRNKTETCNNLPVIAEEDRGGNVA
jgi:hypothetical protein